MEWKDRYPKKSKPPFKDLLDFFAPHVRELFLTFDQEMRDQFNVHNKYHRYSNTVGWSYGYGRSYNCELLTVTVQSECFGVLGISVKDEDTLKRALEEAKKQYDNGFEKRYADVSSKRKLDQIERSKKRAEREKLQIDKLMETVDSAKFNKFKWCRKVSRNDLLRLYQSEATGLLNEELLDDIGYTFYTRCKQAKEARQYMEKGQIICHHCDAVIGGHAPLTGSVVAIANNDALIYCECGYVYTYREYRRSCNTANMPGGRATPIFERFSQKWTACKNASDKMMLIYWLIHECHVTLMSGSKGLSVCVNLIEGTQKQISNLITKLAYEEK